VSIFGPKTENRRLIELEEAHAKLRRDFANLEAEWSNAYDKLRRMMMRVAKRAEVAEKAAEEPEQLPLTNGLEPGHARPGLSDRQRALQQTILRRRAGG
jgi:hypothetical protein